MHHPTLLYTDEAWAFRFQSIYYASYLILEIGNLETTNNNDPAENDMVLYNPTIEMLLKILLPQLFSLHGWLT